MKNALIVGASRGLGLGLAGKLLARGWQATATVRSHSNDLASLQENAGGNLQVATLDINDRAQSVQLAGSLDGQRFDLLFLNAGILLGWNTALEDIPDADISAIFFTNAISPIRTADALVECVASGGMIAFMSSVLGSVATNDDGRAELYRASKAALNSLARSFRARHADRDLTILLLHPGVVRTRMGGEDAPLDIETSVNGVADVIEQRWGTGGITFVDYRGEIVPW